MRRTMASTRLRGSSRRARRSARIAAISVSDSACRSMTARTRSCFEPKWYCVADALRCPARSWISRIGTSIPLRANRYSAARRRRSRVSDPSRGMRRRDRQRSNRGPPMKPGPARAADGVGVGPERDRVERAGEGDPAALRRRPHQVRRDLLAHRQHGRCTGPTGCRASTSVPSTISLRTVCDHRRDVDDVRREVVALLDATDGTRRLDPPVVLFVVGGVVVGDTGDLAVELEERVALVRARALRPRRHAGSTRWSTGTSADR